MRDSRKFEHVILLVCAVLCIIGAVIVGICISIYIRGEEEYESLRDNVVVFVEETTVADGGFPHMEFVHDETEISVDATKESEVFQTKEVNEIVGKKPAPVRNSILQVDFATLQSQNPDTVGWIDIPGTNISYPLMYRGGSDSYYLNHTFEGVEGDKPGAIHIDQNCSEVMAAQNVIIHGHNLASGKMFSQLNRYKNFNYYAQHSIIRIYMPEGGHRTYKIVAVVVTEGADPGMYIWDFADNDSAQRYYDNIMAQSIFPTGNQVNAVDGKQTILLSTCYKTNYRRLILAVEQ